MMTGQILAHAYPPKPHFFFSVPGPWLIQDRATLMSCQVPLSITALSIRQKNQKGDILHVSYWLVMFGQPTVVPRRCILSSGHLSVDAQSLPARIGAFIDREQRRTTMSSLRYNAERYGKISGLVHEKPNKINAFEHPSGPPGAPKPLRT
ncbi:hypothetical protein, partial [Mesorhizobium helmanticense]|uniref:hypothetical protein n=1 Tax=Mesorhizobium helmanticense TaxID=1776423 RepID=UPI001ABFE5E2